MSLSTEVALRRAGKRNFQVRLYDLSPDGCKVEFVERPAVFERMWVKIEGMQSIEAIVCWTKGHCAGLQFVQPIHSAVFDVLIRRLAPDDSRGD